MLKLDLLPWKKFLTRNRPSFLQIGMAGGGRGQILPPPCNFYLAGPIEMKLTMWIAFGKVLPKLEHKLRKIGKSLPKMLI